ncbi:hypothetical protein EDL96_11120 [Kocuria soli]|uniref:Uncharacterized protein n=1 Tax=Kocuria soli TaxID=2485125 RepID=A0A3N3ZN91_9MICC|nr:hypothetical protein [Kocuria soli]ROZ62229.1 hypothetical protein EDL96_11120 [Kocuria soli]
MADAIPTADGDALRRPSSLTADPDRLTAALQAGGDHAKATLEKIATGKGNTVADKVAAAVILAARFDDRSGVESVTQDEATDGEVLGLEWAPELEDTARGALGEHLIVSLLTWASSPSPLQPPVAAAEAAARLAVDDDGAIYRKVSQRATQLSGRQDLDADRRRQLTDLTDALDRADRAAQERRHPDHSPEAEPQEWSSRDEDALANLLEGNTEPRPAQAPAQFEDPRWGESSDNDQEPPGPGPHRAYDPRALLDGPMSEAQRADEKNVLRNWGITALVLVAVLILVGLLI